MVENSVSSFVDGLLFFCRNVDRIKVKEEEVCGFDHLLSLFLFTTPDPSGKEVWGFPILRQICKIVCWIIALTL